MSQKACSKCSEVKPLSQFGKDSRHRDGLRSDCKACRAVVLRLNHERNKAERNQQSRDRYAANAEAARAYARTYRAENKQQVSASRAAYRKANRKRLAVASAAWYYASEDNRRLVAERNKAWREANARRAAELAKVGKATRRARLKGATAYRVTDAEVTAVLRRPCAVDGCQNQDITIDHVIPLTRGGSHGIGNMQPLCRSHNASKGARLWIEFRTALTKRQAESA